MGDDASEIVFADGVPLRYVFQEVLYALRDLVDEDYTPVDRLKVLIYLALILRDRFVARETVDKALRELAASSDKVASKLFVEFRDISAWRWIDSILLRPEVFRGLDLREENDPGTVDSLRAHVSGRANHFLRAASAFLWTNNNWAVYLKEEPKKSGKYILAEGKPNTNSRTVAERGAKSIIESRSSEALTEDEPLSVLHGQRVDECANRLDFPRHHAAHIKAKLKKNEEPSCLYYLLIRVNRLKPAIVAVNTWAGREMSEMESLHDHLYWDMSVWSTLGDADVIVRFRTSTPQLAEDLAHKITTRLKGTVLREGASKVVNYLADSSGRDENPQLIAVDEEYVNGVLAEEPEWRGYLQGQIEVPGHWDSYNIKSCRYFVFIHYPYSENRGREQLETTRWYYGKDQNFRILVDSISSCRDFSRGHDWCDLRLMSSLNDVSDIPRDGKILVLVASVDQVLHFRVFDRDDKMVEDTNEDKLTLKVKQIDNLKELLKDLWPPHELVASEKERILEVITSIIDYLCKGSWMVLEGYLSCGGVSELSSLSEKLESAFDPIDPFEDPKLSLGTKKTHIAYALKYQWEPPKEY